LGKVEFQNIQPSLRLNRKNYLKWSHFVQTFLKAKGKSGHLSDNPLNSLDHKFTSWEEVDGCGFAAMQVAYEITQVPKYFRADTMSKECF